MTHFEDTCFVILTTEMAGTRGTYGEEKKRILSFGWVTWRERLPLGRQA